MDFEAYRKQARRTQNKALSPEQKLEHALCGIAAEVGETLVTVDWRRDMNGYSDEAGDLLWFLAEYCDAMGLKDVFPVPIEGFTTYGGGSCDVTVHEVKHRVRMQTALAYHAGQLLSAHQKLHQGHPLALADQCMTVGRMLGVIGGIAKMLDIESSLGELCEQNIDKLWKRYPEGFDSNRSVNREN